MKKILSVLVALSMVFGLACACAEEAQPETPMPGNMVGGWTPAEDPAVTEEEKAVFDKGMENLLGVNYTPVAYLGSQVVAGINHAFLCQATVVAPNAVPSWKIVFMYQDLQGGVSIMNIADFDFGALCTYGAVEE